MLNDETTVAARLSEPANKTVLVVEYGHEDWKVIWRDDSCAPDAHPDERWVEDSGSDPMCLYQHVKYAKAVYRLGEAVAVFRP